MSGRAGPEKHSVLRDEDTLLLPLPDHARAPLRPGREARGHFSHSHFSIYNMPDHGKGTKQSGGLRAWVWFPFHDGKNARLL